jgi:hypothetical protein
MKVIALSGWKQSGKDTLANYLIENHGFIRYAFADTLKNMVAETYNIPRDHCDNVDFKEKPILKYPVSPKDKFSYSINTMMIDNFRGENGEKPTRYVVSSDSGFMGAIEGNEKPFKVYWTPRALCILEGSIKRSVTSQFWVQTVIDTIKRKNEGLFVISDMRYLNEMDQLKKAFGDQLITIRVNRFEQIDTTDPSERDLDDANFNIVLNNKGSVVEYYETIKEKVCPVLSKF